MSAFLVDGEGGFGIEVFLTDVAFVFAGILVRAKDVLPALRHRFESLFALSADKDRDAVRVEFTRTVAVAVGFIFVSCSIVGIYGRLLLTTSGVISFGTTSSSTQIDDQSRAVFLLVVAVGESWQVKSRRGLLLVLFRP